MTLRSRIYLTCGAQEESDAELKKMAEDDARAVAAQLPDLEARLLQAMVPKDSSDERSAILEVRAGAGGLEASLFAEEVFNMYRNFCGVRRWTFEQLEYSPTEIGGIRDATASIKGDGAFGRLKFESGVHRVQRVPVTGKGGVIHTSTITVAILPEAEDVDVKLEPRDVKVDVMRAGGAGGQHVNKTESAVRVTHLPTGIVVGPIQDTRSQHQNKDRAFKILRAKLFEREREALAMARSSDRKLQVRSLLRAWAASDAAQVGTGERGERIRTYNYPQGRITDHRVNSTKHGIDRMMSGELLNELVEELAAWEQTKELEKMLKEGEV